MLPVWTAPDLLEVVCRHVDTVLHLGMLSQVRRCFFEYLFSYVGGKHWLHAGRVLCGEAHWPEVNGNLPHSSDGRYIAMLRICPWLSEVQHFRIDAIRGYMALGAGACVVRGMSVVGDRCLMKTTFYASGQNGAVFGSVHSRAIVSTFARGDDGGVGPDCAVLPLDGVEFNRFCHTARERELLYFLQAARWRPRALFKTTIMGVRVVHAALLCVVCCCTETARRANGAEIYFVSTRTLRVLHEIRVVQAPCFVVANMVFGAGEMWMADRDDHGTFSYYGPRADRRLRERRSEDGLQSAFWAAYRGEVETALEILELRRVNPLRVRWAVGDFCQYTIRGGCTSALLRLLDRFPGFVDYDSLKCAISCGSFEALRILLSKGADPSVCRSEILHHAVACPQTTVEIVELLLQSGASVADAEWWPGRRLLGSLAEGSLGVLQHLLRAGAVRAGVLHAWALRGQDMSILIRALGADPNEANPDGETPLMYAAASLFPNNVLALMDCGARRDARDLCGRSAVDWLEAAARDPVQDWCVRAAHTEFRYGVFSQWPDALRARHVSAVRDLLTVV